MQNNEFNTDQLIIKIISGNASPDEEELFRKIISDSPEFYQEYISLSELWGRSDQIKLTDVPDIDKEWMRIDRKITEFENTVKPDNSVKRILHDLLCILTNPKMKPVYASFVIVFLFLSVLFFWNLGDTDIEQVFLSTKFGERKSFQLPDSSLVVLNCDSKLTFLKDFADGKRNINLEGEAFFSVKKDDVPFIVNTRNARTKVLGTEFNIWARDSETRVVVREGVVSLTSSGVKDDGVKITYNQSSSVKDTNRAEQVKPVEPDYILGWLKGKLVFQKTPVKELVNELERFYNISVTVENKDIESTTISAVFSSSDVDSVLTMVTLALGCEYSFESGRYILQ